MGVTFAHDIELLRPRLQRFALKLARNADDASDLVQETMIKAIEKQHQFEIGSNLSAWCHTILRNTFLSKVRRSSKEVEWDGDERDGDKSDEAMPMQEVATDITDAISMLGHLGDETRNALGLIVSGLTYEQAAERLGVAEGTIKSRVARAREQLRGIRDMDSATRQRRFEELPTASPSDVISLGSAKNNRIASDATKVDAGQLRPVAPLPNLSKLAQSEKNSPPTLMWVKPTELYVDETYQRNLSRKSIGLISRIVQNWNWSHYKPPIVVKDEDSDRFFVIDGQHTAIAAASHPKIDKMPIMVIDADTIAERARSFISHNRDRVAILPTQLHYSSIVAGDAAALEVDKVCTEAGVKILRTPPANGQFRPGETVALSTIRALIRNYGAENAVSVLSILRDAERAPVRADEMKALAIAIIENGLSRDDLSRTIAALPYDAAIKDAREVAASSFLPMSEALASVYARHIVQAPELAA